MSGTKTLPCPACGKRSSGNYCHHCGEALGGTLCTQCGAEVDGRFCSQCGASVAKGRGRPAPRAGRTTAARRQGGSGDISWWVAGGALFIVAFAIALNAVNRSEPPAQLAPGSLAAPSPTPLAQMTPRQTADQLFNRVMAAEENGDSLTVGQFMPLALEAYDAARPLDMDGLFHLAILLRTDGQHEASLAAAEEILASEPNHILGLDAAARAALALGRDDAAASYYERVLANAETERGRPLPEYESHSRFFVVSPEEARAFLGSR